MDAITLSIMIGLLLIFLLIIRVHIGIAMFIAGAVGYTLLSGWLPFISYLKTLAFVRFSFYELSVIPLFLLMGNIASQGGLATQLFQASNAFLGHYRGGIAMSAIGACACFGAICGSSIATAATMGQVALPELKKANYAHALASGSLAAGGTLGILIPPSVILVIYGILAEQNVATMFIAAFIPGIIAMLGYMLAIFIYVKLKPNSGPATPRLRWKQRLQTTKKVWPVISIFFIVLGGIYGGIFTPTEAASVGTISISLLAFATKSLSVEKLIQAILNTASATAMIFLILLGADVLNSFFALSQLPHHIASWVLSQSYPPFLVLAVIIITYILLGCVMDSLSMILLTIPVFLPIILGLDFYGLNDNDKSIWFGILALMVVEIGLITPPVGMNLFIINSLAKDIPIKETYKGILPFLCSDFFRIILLVCIPSLTLYLVRLI